MAVDLGSLFVRIGSETSGLKRGEREVDTATRRMEARIKSTTAAASKLWLAIGGTAAIYAAARAGRALVDASIAMERIENSLQAATGSAAGAQRELGFVRAEAERLGLNLEQTAGAYASLAAAARGTALEGQAAREIFTAVSEASTVMGLSAEQAEGALRALEQMISKGNVQAEELRGQLGERIPGAFQIAARAMGVTTQQLNKMLDSGEVLAADLLPKLAAELHKTYGKDVERAARSTRAEIERLNTAWFDLKLAIGDSGFIDSLTRALRTVTPVLRDIAELFNVNSVAAGDFQLAWVWLITNISEGLGQLKLDLVVIDDAIEIIGKTGSTVNRAVASAMDKVSGLVGMRDTPGSRGLKAVADMYDRLARAAENFREAEQKRLDEQKASNERMLVQMWEENQERRRLRDENGQTGGERSATGKDGGSAIQREAGAATKKSRDLLAEWTAQQELAVKALELELAGKERLIPVEELRANLLKENIVLGEKEAETAQTLVDRYFDLQQQLEKEADLKAQRDREKQSIDALMESQAQQLTIMAEKLRGDEEQARWLETLYSLNLKQAELTSEQTKIIQDNLRSIEEYKAELAEKYRIEQLAAEIIERQITAEERLANALRDVQTAQEAGLLTEVQAAQESQRLTEENRKLAAAYEDLASGISNAFAGTFEGLILGTESVSEAFRNLAVEIQKAIMQALIFEPLKAALTGGMSGMFSGAGFGAGFSQGIQAYFQPMAKGGIVDSPTIVSPTQIAGERGAEAVLPLTRTRGGALGVMADMGSDQGSPVIIQIIDQRQNGGQVERRESRGPNGERRIQLYIRDEVRRQMDQGEYDGVLRRNYGVARTGSGR